MNKNAISVKKLGLSIIALLLALEFIIFPWFDWLDTKKSDLETVKSFVAKQDALLNTKEMLELSIQELDKYTDSFDGLPLLNESDDAAILWLTMVDKIVAKYELEVKNKAPQREVAINDTYKLFTGKLSVSGDYNKVLNLLYDLENIKVGNRIRQVSFYQNKAQPDIVKVNIEFLRVFKRQ